jgi:hypothetical protein
MMDFASLHMAVLLRETVLGGRVCIAAGKIRKSRSSIIFVKVNVRVTPVCAQVSSYIIMPHGIDANSYPAPN